MSKNICLDYGELVRLEPIRGWGMGHEGFGWTSFLLIPRSGTSSQGDFIHRRWIYSDEGGFHWKKPGVRDSEPTPRASCEHPSLAARGSSCYSQPLVATDHRLFIHGQLERRSHPKRCKGFWTHTSPYGELVKLLSVPDGHCQEKYFLFQRQFERRSHPKHHIKTKNLWTSHRFFVLARCKGFEPPTYWFVARHSIQLS